jgi:SAM-dependent methyltransferase
MKQDLKRALRLVIGAASTGGPQNFVGAAWTETVLRMSPPARREQVALFLLSLSPHYFFGEDRRNEAERNRTSREGLMRDLLYRYLNSTFTALDYGCGPGYMAAAVAPHVRGVEAVDISRGVLACARVLNGAENIVYKTPQECESDAGQVDLAYSFAVVQHLSDEAFRSALALLRRRLRAGGTLLIHFAVPGDGWRTEGDWRSDTSLRGRLRLRVGLNCFGRTEDQVIHEVTRAGFLNARTEALVTATAADPDISAQYLLMAEG